MNADLSRITLQLQGILDFRSFDQKTDQKRYTVYWLQEKDGWITPRSISVSFLSEEKKVVRFSDIHRFSPTKKIWPFSTSSIKSGPERVQVSVHFNEIDDDFLKMIIDIFEEPGKDIESISFQDGFSSPHYAWSDKAARLMNPS